MRMRYVVYQVDAFTKEKFTGNPAGVVVHANGLTKKEMQKIARELNNSETAFLFENTDQEYDVETRYFTPTNEVPICGHATIASQYVRALTSTQEGDSDGSHTVVNKTGAGILPVEIIGKGPDSKVIMTQGAVAFGPRLESDIRAKLIDALGITEHDLIENTHIQVVSTGHSKVMIGLKSVDVLNNLQPDMNKLKEISWAIACNGFYTFVITDEESPYLVEGRMFAPAIGIEEDPVTGNANGPLGAYLVEYDLVKHDGEVLKFQALQGKTIKRPGVIDVYVKIENKSPVQVKVSGHAVIVFKTEIEMD
ncbi:PhzF family isomerase [Fusibacter sp. JL216-2]|uniref:PhzF family isomerase n=1 Tax=Fusibacter sp. JL216-2 TaxID=3071453 RepID=UPI003D35528B